MVSKENRKKFQSAICVHILNTTCILFITSNATVPKKIIVRPEEKINLSSNFLRQRFFLSPSQGRDNTKGRYKELEIKYSNSSFFTVHTFCTS